MGSNEDPGSSEPMDEDAAAVEDPMIQEEGAAVAKIPKAQDEDVAVQPVQDIQEMEQDLPGVKKLAGHRLAAVYNRLDPRPDPLVPYVSISSDESSDSEGKRLKSSKISFTKTSLVSVESDADTVILVENQADASRDTEDDDGTEEETLSEASLAAAKEMIIAEVRSLSVSTNRNVITID